jgi:tRNA(Arg) A34 adenosine deaminase TadA
LLVFQTTNNKNEQMKDKDRIKFMREAISLAKEGVESGQGGPFGAVVVKNDKIIGRGNNRVTSTNDPTAHAEVTAIRDACKNIGSFQLEGCEIYTSCEPCPMCLGAIYWARPDRMYYACTQSDAAKIGFDDAFIYKEMELPISDRKIETTQLIRDEAISAFEMWEALEAKTEY